MGQRGGVGERSATRREPDVRAGLAQACNDVGVDDGAGPYFCYPYLALGVFALLAADIGVVIRTAVPGPLFTAAWLVMALVAAWYWLVCVPVSVQIDGGRLRYEAPVASGLVPLRRVTTLRPLPFLHTAAVVGLAGRVPLVVPLRNGFAPVAAELTRHPCQGAYEPKAWSWVKPSRGRRAVLFTH